MPGSNTIWRIDWGDYSFALDRKTLTYDLTETQTGTVWASSLSVGWIELEDRASGERVRHDFATAKLVSLVEKSSSQGKRLLIGLDVLGVPVDLYFICSQHEIQLTVEASRDTRQFLVQEIGLLPGLVSVPDDGASYLVLPAFQGELIFPGGSRKERGPFETFGSLSMPFVGAVHCDRDVCSFKSALSLITDSVYGKFCLSENGLKTAKLDLTFSRDPERRRLDIHIAVKPNANHAVIALNYREKLISDKNHVTLRKKMRERPRLNDLIGSAFIFLGEMSQAEVAEQLSYMRLHLQVTRALVYVGRITNFYGRGNEWKRELSQEIHQAIADSGAMTAIRLSLANNDTIDNELISLSDGVSGISFPDLWDDLDVVVENSEDTNSGVPTRSRWDELDWRIDRLKIAGENYDFVGQDVYFCDWFAEYTNFSYISFFRFPERAYDSVIAPLFATCYHDAVVPFVDVWNSADFLHALIYLALPNVTQHDDKDIWRSEFAPLVMRAFAVLSPLHRLTFSAFLVEHYFLMPNMMVSAALYSDKTSIVINECESEAFEREDLHLPPLGFYVRHTHMEAHDALRVGEQTFATRAWRIRRSLDGKPLESSEDVLVQEFPV